MPEPELGRARTPGGRDYRPPSGDVGDAHPAPEPRARRERTPEPPIPVTGAPPQIRLGERVLFVGKTGEGKSEAALGLFAVHTGQRLLVDVQDHYELGPDALAEEPAPLEVDDPRAIDWQHRTIRYVPRRPGDRKEMDALFAAIYRRGNLLVLADELEDIAPSQGGGAPFHVRKVAKQGRKRRITVLGASQRPFGVDRSFLNQSEHAFVFRMVDQDDLQALSYRLGMNGRELGDQLNQLDQFEHLRHTIGREEVLKMPPLPPAVVDHTRRHIVNPEHTRR